jgi:uncharacterized repeat protein (TIGR03803 family)
MGGYRYSRSSCEAGALHMSKRLAIRFSKKTTILRAFRALTILFFFAGNVRGANLEAWLTFAGIGSSGAKPQGGLIFDASGTLYGTTTQGGLQGGGIVFSYNPSTFTFTTLDSFGLFVSPDSTLIPDSAGNLYGTTESGGIFELTATTRTLQFVAGLPAYEYPYGGLLIDAAGNLYGTTENGGLKSDGTVFKVDAHTSTGHTLASFSYETTGAYPEAGLIAGPAGNLYGTTTGGGTYGGGTVFKVNPDTGTLTTIAVNLGTAGAGPAGALIADSSGNLYGTAGQGGTYGAGSVYKIDPNTGIAEAVASFNGTDGSDPVCNLIADAAGNLYGTTQYGGTYNDGTVFELDVNTGVLNTLASFDGTDGSNPVAGLVADSNGNLWGTTFAGGNSGIPDRFDFGTLFEVTDTGFVVPEPSSLGLLGVASIGLSAHRRRRIF